MSFSTTKDGNRASAVYGLSSVDGVTPTRIKINPVDGDFIFDIGTSISAVIANLKTNAFKDDNRVPVMVGTSNTDSTVIIPISVNPTNGAILASS